MKKQILISFSIILSVFLLLVGCSNSKQNNKNAETTDISTVKIGKYFGEPYNVYSSFIPILTLENRNKFEFELGISKSIEGTYKIDKNKLILASSDGSGDYILDISNNRLVIKQGIPDYVKKGADFKLSEKSIINKNNVNTLSTDLVADCDLDYDLLIIAKGSVDFYWKYDSEDNIPKRIIDEFEKCRNINGFSIISEDNSSYLIAIGLGSQPTQDYGFDIEHIIAKFSRDKMDKGVIEISVREKKKTAEIGNRKISTFPTCLIRVHKDKLPVNFKLNGVLLQRVD